MPAATDPNRIAPVPGRHQATLVYDGDCGFCTASARWLAEHTSDRVQVVASQQIDLADHGLTDADVAWAAWWLTPGDVSRSGADAIAAALRATSLPWNVAGYLLAVPGVIHLARLGYPMLARNRHRLPGATDACRLG